MKIVLAVTGSISAYKSYEVLRLLVKDGHQVRVILSQGALAFTVKKVFDYLGAEETYLASDDFSLSQHQKILHIDLAKWADRVVLAPASANTINKLGHGLANDLLSNFFLAAGKIPWIIFPAMNSAMLEHAITQSALKNLRQLDHVFIHPTASGELACGDVGEGRLAPIETIFHVATCLNFQKGERPLVMITAGATVSPLDPVRYLTNPSTGKVGFELTKQFLKMGYDVTVIAGIFATSEFEFLQDVPDLKIIRVTTTENMLEKVLLTFSECQVYISTAAINDIAFFPHKSKIKKTDFVDSLPIKSNPDILKTVLAIKKPHQYIVGFAAETDLSDRVLDKKMANKPVDLLIANEVCNGLLNQNGQANQIKGFQVNSADYHFIHQGKKTIYPNMTKKELSLKISEMVTKSHKGLKDRQEKIPCINL